MKYQYQFLCKIILFYRYKLNYKNPFLFDNKYQSISFNDMVISIETDSTPYSIDFQNLNKDEYFVMTNSYNFVVTNILSTLWGVTPPYKYKICILVYGIMKQIILKMIIY